MKEPEVNLGKLQITVSPAGVQITLPINTLVWAAEEHPDFEENPVKVIDVLVFAKEVARVLGEGQEDGSTIITNLFDDAIRMAVEDGCEGIEY